MAGGLGTAVLSAFGATFAPAAGAERFTAEFLTSDFLTAFLFSVFFDFVVLQTEALAAVDVQDLADVPVRLRENQLISPRFGNALDWQVIEEMIIHCQGVLLMRPSGNRMATLSMMNSSISCAVFFVSATSAMRLQSR